MPATAEDRFAPVSDDAMPASRPRSGPAPNRSTAGLVGRDALVRQVRILVAEARGPVCLAGPAGSGSAAIAAAAAGELARGTRVFGVGCAPDTTFAHLTQILAGRLEQHDLSGHAAVVLTDVGAVEEPGFVRALAHLAAGVPALGWLIAGAPDRIAGAHAVTIPLLSEAETGRAVDAAVLRHAAAISKVARIAAATLARGLPGLADRLVAEAWTAAVAAGDDGIGLPHLRAAARSRVGPEVAAEAPALRRAAARTPLDPDGSFSRAALMIALERAGETATRGVAPERDSGLVAAGRGRLRFADDAVAAHLLLSEFGWTLRRG